MTHWEKTVKNSLKLNGTVKSGFKKVKGERY